MVETTQVVSHAVVLAMTKQNVPTYVEMLEAEYNELLDGLSEANDRFGVARAHVEPLFAAVAAEKNDVRRWAPSAAAVDEYNAASDAVLEIHRKMRDVIARLAKS